MKYIKKILYKYKQISVKEIVIDFNLAKNIYEICKKYGNNIILVTDKNTIKLLSKNILNKIPHIIIINNKFIVQKNFLSSITFSFSSSKFSTIKNRNNEILSLNKKLPLEIRNIASIEIINLIRNRIKDSDIIIAFGSGTINDICKYVSYLEKKDYILFPTAASMNGYTSANSSILIDGYKKSLAAHLPKALYIDIDIIVNAPLRLTLSGFADFICISTVKADWLLSNLILSTKYDEIPFILVNDLRKILLKEYKVLLKKNKKVILLLMKALLISGFGMVISNGSYSASQGEHMIAHAMEILTKDYFSLHGEKIAVTTLTMTNLQEKILSIQNPVINNKPFFLNKSNINKYFHNKMFINILEQKKNLHKKIFEIIYKEWNIISDLIRNNLLPKKQIQKIFEDLSIPHLPEHLGWNYDQYTKIVNFAFTTRDRFTFLDLIHYIKI